MPKPTDKERALFDAMYQKSPAAAKKMIDAGVSASCVDEEGTTLLHVVGIRIWNTRKTPDADKWRAFGDYLIERGGKLDFMAAAMLDKADFVAAALAKNPKLAKSRFKVNDHSVREMAGWCGAKNVVPLLNAAGKASKKPATPAAESKQLDKWTETIAKATVAELGKYGKRNPEVVLKKVGFDLNVAEGDVFLAVDTSGKKNWRPSSSHIADRSEQKALRAIVDEAKEESAKGKMLLLAATAALAKLKASKKVVGPLKLAKDFDVIAVDHDESEAAAKKRMAAVVKTLG